MTAERPDAEALAPEVDMSTSQPTLPYRLDLLAVASSSNRYGNRSGVGNPPDPVLGEDAAGRDSPARQFRIGACKRRSRRGLSSRRPQV